jgi:hypothetical protein
MEEIPEDAPVTPAVNATVRPLAEWSLLKGHIPDGYKVGLAAVDARNPPKPRRGPRFRGDFHKGPHVAVLVAHLRGAVDQPMTEADYDALVKAAYSIEFKEN